METQRAAEDLAAESADAALMEALGPVVQARDSGFTRDGICACNGILTARYLCVLRYLPFAQETQQTPRKRPSAAPSPRPSHHSMRGSTSKLPGAAGTGASMRASTSLQSPRGSSMRASQSRPSGRPGT